MLLAKGECLNITKEERDCHLTLRRHGASGIAYYLGLERRKGIE